MEHQNSGTENNSNNNANRDFNCSVELNNKCSPSNDIKVLKKACGNGINPNIFKCNTKRCKFQLGFYPFDKVVSSVIKRLCCRTRNYILKLSLT